MLSLSLCSAMAVGAAAQPGPVDRAVDLPLDHGGSLRVLVAAPPQPKGFIVMLPGGAGVIGIGPNGHLQHGNNFVVRTRMMWNQRGYAVLIPDSMGHRNLRGLRSSAAYADLVGQLVRFAREQTAGPVFILGTSQGAIAAMNGAAHVPEGSLSGVVLTESVSVMGGSGETVFEASPGKVRVPALVVANEDDRCKVATPKNAQKIAAAMTASPDVRVLMVSGGISHNGDDCASLSPHGYYGIETQVVGQIADWMDAHQAPSSAPR